MLNITLGVMGNLTDWQSFHTDVFEKQPVLITGGAGFIGSHLAHALNDLGTQVTVLDDLSGGGDPAALPPAVEFVKGSILDQSLLQNAPMAAVTSSTRPPSAPSHAASVIRPYTTTSTQTAP